MSSKMQESLAVKVSFIMCSMMIVLSLIIGVVGLFFYYRDQLLTHAQMAQTIAITTASGIDGDAYEVLTQTFTPDEYHAELQELVDGIKRRTDAMYLYGLDTGVDGTVRYVVDAFKPGDDPALICELGYLEEPGIFAAETFEVLVTGQPTISSYFDSGIYGIMVSGYAPIFNSAGKTVGVLGADIEIETLNKNLMGFSLNILGVIFLVVLVNCFLVVYSINKRVGKPIRKLVAVSEKIALGETNIDLPPATRNEIGHLVEAFRRMLESTQEEVDVLRRIADNDYTGNIALRSENDLLNRSIRQILENNITLIASIRTAAGQVANGAEQIAAGVQVLAGGSGQQTDDLYRFAGAVAVVYEQAVENTRLTEEALAEVAKVRDLMMQSTAQMEQMGHAMSTIQGSSEEIAKVMKVIDDIAFQTNILALNAAVEAARAGQYGRGFAVVADEVRNLSRKSADASRETAAMITTSVENVKLGSQMARITEKGMLEVVEITARSASDMQKISDASLRQTESVREINSGIERISTVVQANTASAEEGAAAAEEMSAQAAMLEKMVEQFRLPEDKTGFRI